MSESIFMDVTDMKGSSTQDGFKDQQSILSMSHSLNMPTYSGSGQDGRTSGRVNIADITLTKMMDVNSVNYNKWCCNAHLIPTIKITVCRQKGDALHPMLVYTLTDSLVSSYSVSASGANPIETVTFNFDKIQIQYVAQDAKGSKAGNVEMGWSTVEGKPV